MIWSLLRGQNIFQFQCLTSASTSITTHTHWLAKKLLQAWTQPIWPPKHCMGCGELADAYFFYIFYDLFYAWWCSIIFLTEVNVLFKHCFFVVIFNFDMPFFEAWFDDHAMGKVTFLTFFQGYCGHHQLLSVLWYQSNKKAQIVQCFCVFFHTQLSLAWCGLSLMLEIKVAISLTIGYGFQI